MSSTSRRAIRVGNMDGSLRILCLDDGGIAHGYSQLVILGEITNRIKESTSSTEEIKPCTLFHFISGAGVGGIIAILLGRLRLTVPEAQKEYILLTSRVFWRRFGPRNLFSRESLEGAIKDLVGRYENDEELGMLDNRSSSGEYGRCFVLATPARAANHPRFFRSYRVGRHRTDDCPIWSAVRATTAAPALFETILLGTQGAEEEYIGSTGHSNPTIETIREARRIYNENVHFACVLSLGTGKGPRPALPENSITYPEEILNFLGNIANECEKTAGIVPSFSSDIRDAYFRLDVEQGMQFVPLHSWGSLGEVATYSVGYLQDAEVCAKLDSIVSKMRQSTDSQFTTSQGTLNITDLHVVTESLDEGSSPSNQDPRSVADPAPSFPASPGHANFTYHTRRNTAGSPSRAFIIDSDNNFYPPQHHRQPSASVSAGSSSTSTARGLHSASASHDQQAFRTIHPPMPSLSTASVPPTIPSTFPIQPSYYPNRQTTIPNPERQNTLMPWHHQPEGSDPVREIQWKITVRNGKSLIVSGGAYVEIHLGNLVFRTSIRVPDRSKKIKWGASHVFLTHEGSSLVKLRAYCASTQRLCGETSFSLDSTPNRVSGKFDLQILPGPGIISILIGE